MSIALPVTLREITRYSVPALVWLVLTAIAAVAGPFGTLDVMGPVGRAVYWGSIIGLSLGFNPVAKALASDRSLPHAIAIWVGFVLLLSGTVHAVNSVVFSSWSGVGDWAYLTGVVGLVTGSVHLVIYALFPHPIADVADQDVFMRRLPFDVRAPLVRIEAQDHYLFVVTTKGNTLILMRLGDAAAELSGQGLRVHRSHWIAPEEVSSLRREKGRDVLLMSDGEEIPVSRSYRSAVQAVGLI